MTLFLADSSIWIATRRRRAPHLTALFTERLQRDQILGCVPVALEVMVGPADSASYDRDWATSWESLRWLPLTDSVSRRALEVQRGLAHTTAGAHRRRPMDYLIAACAEAAGREVILWHWDSDLTVICEHTGQPHEPEHERALANGLEAP